MRRALPILTLWTGIAVSACSSARSAKDATTADMVFRADKLKEENEHRRQDLQRLRARVSALDDELIFARGKLLRLGQERDAVAARASEKDDDVQRLDRQIAAREREADAVDRQLHSLKSGLNQLKLRANADPDAAESDRRERELLQAEISRLESQIHGIEDAISNLLKSRS